MLIRVSYISSSLSLRNIRYLYRSVCISNLSITAVLLFFDITFISLRRFAVLKILFFASSLFFLNPPLNFFIIPPIWPLLQNRIRKIQIEIHDFLYLFFENSFHIYPGDSTAARQVSCITDSTAP